MKTLAKLRRAFEQANKRVDKALDRYKIFLCKHEFYIAENYVSDGRHTTYSPRNRYVAVLDAVVDKNGEIRSYATELDDVFYIRCRNGAFRESKEAYYKLRNLEHDIDTAEEYRDAFLTVFRAIGIDFYENYTVE